MRRSASICSLIPVMLIGLSVRPAKAEITAEQVRRSIDRGVAYLKSKQSQRRGNWDGYPTQPGGVTALCTLALINSGVDVQDESIQKALAYLRTLGNPKMTYAASLQTMAFCAAEPKKDKALILRNAKWLQQIQIESNSADKHGTWAYSDHQGTGDNSNTQFALLALHEAERVGIPIAGSTWRAALAHWKNTQHDDGSWGYPTDQSGSGSMTCAGVASVVIASGRVNQGDARVVGAHVVCCGQQAANDTLDRGLAWLGRNFSVTSNPSVLAGKFPRVSQMWLLYYLYGMERVGRLTGRRFFINAKGGKHDWYRRGAEMLVSQQDRLQGLWIGAGVGEQNPLVATSFALLFLSKGRRPVVIAKLRHGITGDWNLHRSDAANLTRYVEKRWQRDLTWQVIDPRTAAVEDLLGAPVLYLSGRDSLVFGAATKKKLREYVEAGGFIFAESCESCCGAGEFDRDFRKLMKELFPNSPLRPLPPDHPAWFAEEKVDPDFLEEDGRWLWGVDACCRTSVIYCPGNLSCYWELSRPEREEKYPVRIRDEIAACNAIGANVLAYATGRQLRDKLDTPRVTVSDPDHGVPLRGALRVAKLRHGGGSDDAPAALTNLLTAVAQQVKLPVDNHTRLLAMDDPVLAEYPIAFMHGRRQFRMTEPERKALAKYIERGGFLFADAICASPAFAESFRRELAAIFPGARLKRIPADDPLLTPAFRGYDLAKVTLRDPQFRVEDGPMKVKQYQTAPLLEAIEIDGRYAVVFSPYDISCAMENGQSLECKGYIREDAARIGTNVILYALQQ